MGTVSGYDYWDLQTGEGLSDSELHERYDNDLDEVFGDFMDAYPASRVLKEVDPIAYHVGFNDFTDRLLVGKEITEDEPEDEDEDD